MPKKAKYKATPKTAISEDTLPIEETAVDAFLFLYDLERANTDKIRIELLPSFIADLVAEIEELKKLRDQMLR